MERALLDQQKRDSLLVAETNILSPSHSYHREHDPWIKHTQPASRYLVESSIQSYLHHVSSYSTYVIFEPREGFGNRLRSLLGILTFAVLTKRKLLIQWNEPVDWKYLIMNPMNYDWVMTTQHILH